MVKKILLIFLAWRIFIFLIPLLTEKIIKFREGFDYVYGNVWANFDGVYYLYIAKSGYTVDNAGFFPLYPLLIRIFSVGEGSIQFFVGSVLSSVFLLLGILMLFKLIQIDFDKKIAFIAVAVMFVFPTSFFFVAIYSESLFLLLTLSSFYFARKKNWILASLLASLLTATRIVGIALIPALVYEFIRSEGAIFKRKALGFLLSPLGILFYMYFNFKELGNAFQFVTAQGALHNERSVDQIVLFPQTIFRYFNILTSLSPSVYEWWIALLELSAFTLALILIYIAWKKKVRFSYLIFSVIALLIPASTGTFSGLPRYVLILFPIFIALALIQNRWARALYFLSGIVLLVILFSLFAKGYFVA
jgi:hypothetical protein